MSVLERVTWLPATLAHAVRADAFQHLLVVVLRECKRILGGEGYELAAGDGGIGYPGGARQGDDGGGTPQARPIYLPGPLSAEEQIYEQERCEQGEVGACEDQRQEGCARAEEQRPS